MTFNSPRFGGNGTIDIQMELPCPCISVGFGCLLAGYVGIGPLPVVARSTDFDADGNTDQNDKLALGAALLSGNLLYDFNVDGSVNADDYRLLAQEMAYQKSHPVDLFKCPNNCPGQQVPCALVPVNNVGDFRSDDSPPGNPGLSVSVAGGNATLSWTSPGDDGQIGVAQAFDIRSSGCPITASNFDQAMPLTEQPPVPGLPNTPHTLTVPIASYYAIRTTDWAGLTSVFSVSTVTPITVGSLAVSLPAAVEIVGQNGVIDPNGVTCVHVEENGQPKSGVLVELSYSEGSIIAESQPDMLLNCLSRRLGNVTDANGNARIHVLGGANASGCAPPDPNPANTGFGLHINGSFSGAYLPYRSFDLTGNQTVDANDLSRFLQMKGCDPPYYYPVVDYDGNGSIGEGDEDLWLARSFAGSSSGPGGAMCTPPATTTDLGIISYVTNPRSVTVRWTAPGDDGTTGQAHHYEIRKRSGAEITEANWATSTVVPNPPAPAAPGTLQTKVIDNIPGSGFWYFALKTYDEAGNVSGVSNNPCIKFSSPPEICGGEGFASQPAGEEEKADPVLGIAFVRAGTSPGVAEVAFSLADDTPATLGVFDVAGRRLEDHDLVNLGRGSHTLQIGVRTRLNPGTYWVRIGQAGRTASRSVSLTK